jgi:hypothetical protein
MKVRESCGCVRLGTQACNFAGVGASGDVSPYAFAHTALASYGTAPPGGWYQCSLCAKPESGKERATHIVPHVSRAASCDFHADTWPSHVPDEPSPTAAGSASHQAMVACQPLLPAKTEVQKNLPQPQPAWRNSNYNLQDFCQCLEISSAILRKMEMASTLCPISLVHTAHQPYPHVLLCLTRSAQS